MEDHRKHIDDLFREGLGDYREAPGADVWTSLEQRLPAAAVEEKKSSYKWLWLLLLLAIMATVGYYTVKKMSEAGEEGHKGNTPINKIEVPENNGPVDHPASGIDENKPEKNIAGSINGTTHLNTSSANLNTHLSPKEHAIETEKEHTAVNNKVQPGITASNKAPEAAKTNSNKERHTQPENTDPGKDKGAADNNITGGEATGTMPQPSGKNNNQPVQAVANTPGKSNSGNSKQKRQNDPNQPKAGLAEKETANSEAPAQNIADNNARPVVTPADTPPVSPKAKNKKTQQTQPSSATTISKKEKTAVPGNQTINESLATTGKSNKPETKKAKKPAEEKSTGNKADATKQPATVAAINSSTRANKTKKTEPAAPAGNKKSSKPESSNLAKKKNADEQPSKPSAKKTVKADQYIEQAKNTNPPDKVNAVPKPITVTPDAAGKSELEVTAAQFKKKQLPPADAVNAGKKNYAETSGETVTKSGIRVNPNANAKQQPITVQPASEGINIQPYLEKEAKEEAKMDAEEEAPDEQPAAQATTGSGGGGGSEPWVELRNFNKIHLSAGLKLGYDRGFSNYTTNNFVISPYLQWNITPAFALVLQPGFRYNQINKTQLLDKQSYHEITAQSLDSNHIIIQDTAGNKIQRNYTYSNTYDSIVAGYKMRQNSFWEVELPLYVKYYVTPGFSIMAGGILSFGKIVDIEGDIQRISGLIRYDSLSYQPVPANSSTYPNPPSLNNYFSYNTPEYTAQTNYDNPATNPARFGILFGFSYELKKKFLFDLMIRKTVSGMQYIPNEQVRSIYTQPYFRFSFGYRLFDNDQKKEPSKVEGL